jgi:hypothetical protein
MSLTSFLGMYRLLVGDSSRSRLARRGRSPHRRRTQLGIENVENRLAMTTLAPMAVLEIDPGYNAPATIVSQGPVFRADYSPVHAGPTSQAAGDGSEPKAVHRTAHEPTATHPKAVLGQGAPRLASDPVQTEDGPKTAARHGIFAGSEPKFGEPRLAARSAILDNAGPSGEEHRLMARSASHVAARFESSIEPVSSSGETGLFARQAILDGSEPVDGQPRPLARQAILDGETPTHTDPRIVARDLVFEEIDLTARAKTHGSIIEPVATARGAELAEPRFTSTSDSIGGMGDPRPVSLLASDAALPRIIAGEPVNSNGNPGIFARTAATDYPVFTVTHNPVHGLNDTSILAKAVKS